MGTEREGALTVLPVVFDRAKEWLLMWIYLAIYEIPNDPQNDGRAEKGITRIVFFSGLKAGEDYSNNNFEKAKQ